MRQLDTLKTINSKNFPTCIGELREIRTKTNMHLNPTASKVTQKEQNKISKTISNTLLFRRPKN
jgi:hypothetical protein